MSFESEISKINDIEYNLNFDLTSLTTFRLKSSGNLAKVFSIEGLSLLLKLLKKYKKSYLVLGWGANQILAEKCKLEIILLEFPFDKSYFNQVRTEYNLPASVGLNLLTAHAIKFGLKGWEVFTGIPASLGGAIFMNAGTNLGEIGSLVTDVVLMTTDGEIKEIRITKDSFAYRRNNFVKEGDIIISAKLKHLGIDPAISNQIKEYMDYRRKSQPLSTKNCGCVFKNPLSGFQAGRLIDLLGIKNLKSGDLKVSPKHANFMENHGAANFEDFRTLVNTINFYVDSFYGFEFELEVKIPYDF